MPPHLTDLARTSRQPHSSHSRHSLPHADRSDTWKVEAQNIHGSIRGRMQTRAGNAHASHGPRKSSVEILDFFRFIIDGSSPYGNYVQRAATAARLRHQNIIITSATTACKSGNGPSGVSVPRNNNGGRNGDGGGRAAARCGEAANVGINVRAPGVRARARGEGGGGIRPHKTKVMATPVSVGETYAWHDDRRRIESG